VTDAPTATDRPPADTAVQDAGTVDAPPADTGASGAWPPPGPYHNGKVCTLPACNPSGPETTDLSGTWTQTTTTESHTCNALLPTMDPRLQVGHVETVTGVIINRAGECVYQDTGGGTIVGVIKGNIMISCAVGPPQSGATPVTEGTVTFSGGTASGTGVVYLFDVPLPPATCQANGTVTLTRQ
jgi:hypothetical protein